MKTDKPFAKIYDELIQLGVPLRTAMLYGKLQFMAGDKGECWPTNATLAKIIGLKTRQQVNNLLKQLHALRLIEWKRSRYFCRYRVLKPDVKWILHLMSNRFDISDVTPVLHRKESSSEKKHRKDPLPPNPPSPTAEANAPNAKTTAQQPRTNANANAKPKNCDDDDPNKTPEQRFEARLLRRHGYDPRADTTIKTIKTALANYPGVTFADFLEFDRTMTTGSQFRNPGGYYRRLAEKCGRHFEEQRVTAHMTAAAASATGKANIPRDDKGRCAKCGGSGVLKGGGYCDVCPMGRDLAKAARHKQKSETQSRVDYSAM
jgi:hypothetical protein